MSTSFVYTHIYKYNIRVHWSLVVYQKMRTAKMNTDLAEMLVNEQLLNIDTLVLTIDISRFDTILELISKKRIKTNSNFMIYLEESKDPKYTYDVNVHTSLWDFPSKKKFNFVLIENDIIKKYIKFDKTTRDELFEFSKKDLFDVCCRDLMLSNMKQIVSDAHLSYEICDDIVIGKYGYGGHIVIATKEDCDKFFEGASYDNPIKL